MIIMAQNSTSEILDAIRTAEANADSVRANADDIARKMIADAAAKAERDFEAAVAACADEKKEALAQVKAQADEMVAQSAAAVRAEADKLCAGAEARRADTVDIIFREIRNKCQQA